MKKNFYIKLLKITVGIYLLVILFVIAWNGRYERVGDSAVMDKWRKVVILTNTEELPVLINGEKRMNRKWNN